jgi:2-keto-4-pentenoate hydratase
MDVKVNGAIRMPSLSTHQIEEAARILWSNWAASTRIEALPEACRPQSREEGYAVQAAVAEKAGQRTIGWKIAATSAGGQKHIGVSGPLAGRLLTKRVFFDGSAIPLGNSIMRAAEAEFCFRLGADLPPRAAPYSMEEVMAAVDKCHPSIETPDSRYEDFVTAGAPQLIADTACACWLAIGPAFPDDWRKLDLARHTVDMFVDGKHTASGSGGAVLGDPRLALTWIANELSQYSDGLRAGDYVTTGTCFAPVSIKTGDTLTADYGELGTLKVAIA